MVIITIDGKKLNERDTSLVAHALNLSAERWQLIANETAGHAPKDSLLDQAARTLRDQAARARVLYETILDIG